MDMLPHIKVGSGSQSLFLALKLAGAREDDEVLIPAFHCPSMVKPITELKAIPRFYSLDSRLSVRLDNISALISSKTKAIIAVHYFGFPTDLTILKHFCRERSIFLIEDCAHCFFRGAPLPAAGMFGDAAIASTTKFFPGADGGLLCCSSPGILHGFEKRSSMEELKAVGRLLDTAVDYKRLQMMRLPLWAAHALWRTGVPQSDSKDNDVDDPPGRKPVMPPAAMTKVSRLLLRTASRSRIINRRRANYCRLHEGLSLTANAAPLYPELAAGVVPYMYPLLTSTNSDAAYIELRRRGVPVWRWDESDLSCGVSASYARQLLQLPCHQELEVNELEWIISCVVDVLS